MAIEILNLNFAGSNRSTCQIDEVTLYFFSTPHDAEHALVQEVAAAVSAPTAKKTTMVDKENAVSMNHVRLSTQFALRDPQFVLHVLIG